MVVNFECTLFSHSELAYCLRCDRTIPSHPITSNGLGRLSLYLHRRWQTYFTRSVVGYSIGLFLAMCVSEVLDQGQPALVYIVPPILAFPCHLAHTSGHWHTFWHGKTATHRASTKIVQIV